MPDIFGRTPLTYGGGFAHDGATLSISGGGGGAAGLAGLAMIVQQFAVSYQKRLTKIFEFGQPKFYFVEGPPDGQLQIDNVVGPAGLVFTFAKTLGDICNVNSSALVLEVQHGCDGTKKNTKTTLKMNHPLCDSVSLTGEAQTAILRSQARIMFGSLEQSAGP